MDEVLFFLQVVSVWQSTSLYHVSRGFNTPHNYRQLLVAVLAVGQAISACVLAGFVLFLFCGNPLWDFSFLSKTVYSLINVIRPMR